MENYVSLDLETTGLSPGYNEIIEIGAWKVENGVVTSKFTELIKPYSYVNGEISRITGITNEMLKDAEPVEVVLPDFISFCGDLPIIGHNVMFDYNFLCAKAKYLGLDFSLDETRCGIDTLKLAKKYVPSLDKYDLTRVSEYFKIYISSKDLSFHRAGYDSYVTKLVYDRFLYLFPNLAGVKVPERLGIDNKKYGKAVDTGVLSFD